MLKALFQIAHIVANILCLSDNPGENPYCTINDEILFFLSDYHRGYMGCFQADDIGVSGTVVAVLPCLCLH